MDRQAGKHRKIQGRRKLPWGPRVKARMGPLPPRPPSPVWTYIT